MILRQKNKSILFIYDHSKKTGNGHLRRCEYFSKIFPKKFDTKYQKYNAKLFNDNLDKIYDYIITDSYKINYINEKKLKNYCKKLITIDDNYNRKFASDIIINYSPVISKKIYKRKCLNKTRLFLGEKFNFISKEKYLKNPNISESQKKKLNILIYFGTNDRSNLIDKIKKKMVNNEIINKVYSFNKKKIVPHRTFLKKIEQSDLLLISSGVTLQEGLQMKKMIFATFFSKNQKNFYKYYKKKRLINDLGSFENFIKFGIKKINLTLNQNKSKIKNYFQKKVNNKELWSLVKND